MSEIIDRLISRPIEIAVDTEFHGARTLTIQAATRSAPNEITVQLYRDPQLAAPHKSLTRLVNVGVSNPKVTLEQINLRPPRLITADLSPANLIADLCGVPLVPFDTDDAGRILADRDANVPGAKWEKRHRRWKPQKVKVIIIGHFLDADLLRIFGANYLRTLLLDSAAPIGRVAIRQTGSIGFSGGGNVFATRAPIVQYVKLEEQLVAIQIETRDTQRIFASGSLSDLSATFLDEPKSDPFSAEEKCDMSKVFVERPDQAFAYAVSDAVTTLRVYEAMRSADRDVYRQVGIQETAIPAMRPTVGGRVAAFVETAILQSTTGLGSLSSTQKLKKLMRRGGRKYLAAQAHSKFGQQTYSLHGGLLLNRSSTQLWHEAPGMLRDVDLASCYPTIIRSMSLYVGRPVVLEPGADNLRLSEAIKLLSAIADDDAWMVRVTGDIASVSNVLIPSTKDAVTFNNYRRRRLTQVPIVQPDKSSSRLYTHRIESGVVTSDTALAIGLLPASAQAEYFGLRVESILCYPRKLVASTASEYDELVCRLHNPDLPWRSLLELDHLQITTTEHLDQEYATLRFPLGDLAGRLQDLRREAQVKFGKGSAADITAKIQANTLYGILASDSYVTSNVVAANYITAAGRARAFVLALALNGIQTITDGVTYRRDCIPSGSLADCLEFAPNYPQRHVTIPSRFPFADANSIPVDDSEFRDWFPVHATRFFSVDRNKFRRIFDAPLSHKAVGVDGLVSFDSLACDGGANNVKYSIDRGIPKVLEAKMRGYGRTSKATLIPLITQAYRSDTLSELLPLTSEAKLMKLYEAVNALNRYFRDEQEVAILPLGYEAIVSKLYKAIKLSAFICSSPKQEKAICRQIERFESQVGPLDLIALRRGYQARRGGALSDVLNAIDHVIDSDAHDLAKALNLRPDRITEDLRDAAQRQRSAREGDRRSANAILDRAITVNADNLPLTGLQCSRANLPILRQRV